MRLTSKFCQSGKKGSAQQFVRIGTKKIIRSTIVPHLVIPGKSLEFKIHGKYGVSLQHLKTLFVLS